jgi:hypothetical protein
LTPLTIAVLIATVLIVLGVGAVFFMRRQMNTELTFVGYNPDTSFTLIQRGRPKLSEWDNKPPTGDPVTVLLRDEDRKVGARTPVFFYDLRNGAPLVLGDGVSDGPANGRRYHRALRDRAILDINRGSDPQWWESLMPIMPIVTILTFLLLLVFAGVFFRQGGFI